MSGLVGVSGGRRRHHSKEKKKEWSKNVGYKPYTAYNEDGLSGIHIKARNKKEALKYARDIHGKNAQVEEGF